MEMLSIANNNASENELREINEPKHLGKVLEEVYDLKRDDKIRLMGLKYIENRNWMDPYVLNVSISIQDLLDEYVPILSSKEIKQKYIDTGICAIDYYIGHCTHDGSSKYRKENCVEITCLVIDIDFGSDGHKKVTFETESDALRHIEQNLPDPTMILHTGGGFQVFYKLTSRIPVQKNIINIENVSKGLTYLAKGDSCHTVEHTFRLPMSFNSKIRFKPRPVRIIKYNPSRSFTLDELERFLTEKGVDISKVKLKEPRTSSTSHSPGIPIPSILSN